LRTHPVTIARPANYLDYDIRALANSKGNDVGHIRFCPMWEHSAEQRKKVDCSVEWISKLICMRDMNVHVIV
jgi:hypothetical protein